MSILAHNPLRCLSTVCNNFFPQTHTHIESVSHVWPYQHPINLQLYKCYGNSGRPILAPSPYLWVFVQLWYSLLQKRSMLPTDDLLLTRNLPIGDVLCTRDTIKISFPPTMLCCEWEWGPHLCSSLLHAAWADPDRLWLLLAPPALRESDLSHLSVFLISYPQL